MIDYPHHIENYGAGMPGRIERCRKRGICYRCDGNGVELIHHLKACDTFPFVENDYVEEIECTLCGGTGDFTERENE